MTVRATIGRFVAILALLGLVLGPFARPAQAVQMSAPAGQTDMAMPDGMPCCPDETPMQDCPKMACPSMTMCMAAALQAVLPAGTLALPQPAAAVLRGSDDSGLAGLAARPPPRPPKA
jgi:hypothetical protein